jgi:Helix-turn-helix domain
MSIEITSAVWKHSRQKSGALLVLLALADYTNSKDIAWPAVSTLARKVRMSKRNVQRCIRALQQAGELEVRRNQGRRGSNIYRICVPIVEPDKRDANVTHEAGVAKALSPPSSGDDASVTQSVSESLTESTPIVPNGDINFWIEKCFACFRQSSRPLPNRVLDAVRRAVPFLKKKEASALIEFYREEPLDSKKVPFNSRKHSPERLLLHLPEQLALAVQTCPPPPPAKKEPPQWREFFWWKYDPTVWLPKSFHELPRDLQQEYEHDFQTFVNQNGTGTATV